MKTYLQFITEMADLTGMEVECIPHEVLVDELNHVNKWRLADQSKRGTFYPKNKVLPRIHTTSVKDNRFGTDEQTIEDFIESMRFDLNKDHIIGTNEKMNRSGQSSEIFVKIGIPPFKGILYDEEKQKFFVVKTCPGAHGCNTICYAMHGRYVQYGSSVKTHKVLNLLINHPDQFEEQLLKDLTWVCNQNQSQLDSFNTVTVRFNESGDFFWQKYYDIAKRVIRQLQKTYNIRATAYTKIPEIANDNNDFIDVTFSTSFSKPGAIEKLNPKVRLASILPKEKFEHLFVRDGVEVKSPTRSGMKILQQLVADEIGVPVEYVINYHEMMRIPEGKKRKYYVLVMSGAGDDAVTRKDVKEVILAEH